MFSDYVTPWGKISSWELRVSQRELHRMHMAELTLEGRETVAKAKLLGISTRQMKRLRRKMNEGGRAVVLNGNRGKPGRTSEREEISFGLHAALLLSA